MLSIVKYPDSRLKQVSRTVEDFGNPLHELLDDMARTMYAVRGVGLAAPQIGLFIRAFIIDISSEDDRHTQLLEMINPEIIRSEGKISWEEGCLSVPGYTERVARFASVTVRYQDRLGDQRTLDGNELLAVAIQHETDHINGLLFIDRLSPLKRRFLKRKIEKGLQL